jgi:hypothetical protein
VKSKTGFQLPPGCFFREAASFQCLGVCVFDIVWGSTPLISFASTFSIISAPTGFWPTIAESPSRIEGCEKSCEGFDTFVGI